MDAKKILQELDKRREKFTFSLEKKLMDEFRAAIGNAPQNVVLERIMRDFLDSLKNRK